MSPSLRRRANVGFSIRLLEGKVHHAQKEISHPQLSIISLLIVTVVILVRVARSQGGWLFPVMERIDDQSVVRLGVLALSIGTLIMVTIGSSTMIFAALLIAQSITSDTILNVLTTVPAESRLVVGIMILLVGGFFVGVPAALTVEPPLPHVKVAKNNGQGATWGRLVIHSEGFWYLFVGPNRNTVLGLLDWSYELLSIPDAEVLTVQTVGKVDKYIAGELEHD